MVTIVAGVLPGLIGGSVIIETIFSIPGHRTARLPGGARARLSGGAGAVRDELVPDRCSASCSRTSRWRWSIRASASGSRTREQRGRARLARSPAQAPRGVRHGRDRPARAARGVRRLHRQRQAVLHRARRRELLPDAGSTTRCGSACGSGPSRSRTSASRSSRSTAERVSVAADPVQRRRCRTSPATCSSRRRRSTGSAPTDSAATWRRGWSTGSACRSRSAWSWSRSRPRSASCSVGSPATTAARPTSRSRGCSS